MTKPKKKTTSTRKTKTNPSEHLRQRAIERRIREAKFHEDKNLTDFDWKFNGQAIDRAQIEQLATGEFLRRHENLVMVGQSGVGKSYLVQALGYQAIKQGHTVLYRSIFDVVRDFLHEEALSDDKVLARYLKPNLLIVDGMGMKQLPKRSGEYLFEIIMRRYETRSTIMTSNRPLEDWGKLVGDVPSATAILDRFLHHAEIIVDPKNWTTTWSRIPGRIGPDFGRKTWERNGGGSRRP
jgi:DNA replication protein DnaC